MSLCERDHKGNEREQGKKKGKACPTRAAHPDLPRGKAPRRFFSCLLSTQAHRYLVWKSNRSSGSPKELALRSCEPKTSKAVVNISAGSPAATTVINRHMHVRGNKMCISSRYVLNVVRRRLYEGDILSSFELTRSNCVKMTTSQPRRGVSSAEGRAGMI